MRDFILFGGIGVVVVVSILIQGYKWASWLKSLGGDDLNSEVKFKEIQIDKEEG